MSFRPLWAWRAAPARVRDRLPRERRPPGVAAAARAVPRRRRRRGAVLLQPVFAPGRRRRAFADPGPQQRDLDELGWKAHTVTVRQGDTELVLRPGELDAEEIAEWLETAPRRAGRARPGAPRARSHRDAGEPGCAARRADEASVREPDANAPCSRHSSCWRSSPGCSSSTREVSTGSTSRHRRARRPIDVLDRQAARIAGHPADVICDVAGRHVGLRPGRRRAGRGRRPPCLADAADLLPALSDPPHRARQRPGVGSGDRGARSRSLAPARRVERGARELLRLPVGRRGGRGTRALGLDRSTADARTARGQPLRLRRHAAVRRARPGARRAAASTCTSTAHTFREPPVSLVLAAPRASRSATAVATARRLSRKSSSSSAAASPSAP